MVVPYERRAEVDNQYLTPDFFQGTGRQLSGLPPNLTEYNCSSHDMQYDPALLIEHSN